METRIRVVCPQCKAACDVEGEAARGATVTCRACGAEVAVPLPRGAKGVFGHAALADSPDDRQVCLGLTSDAPTLSQAADAPAEPVEAVLRDAQGSAGRYVEQDIIGRGGMGEITLCVDRNIRRQIAMKRILSDAAQDPGRRARFVEEAQLTGQLEHPNIVPVHDLERAPDGTVYYTMKLVRGRSLGALLKAARQGAEAPSLVELLQIFLKVCDAIAFAHSRGVVHRDLKPDNIMLGDFGEVLVVDWGLAKVLGREDLHADKLVTTDRLDGDQTQTLEGALVGTPTYMSPEQAEGRVDAIDERSDIYALGAILYEMLTFERPVEGGTPLEVIVNVVAGHILRPEQRAPARQVPRELADAAMRALATRKEDRYPSVAELRREIALFLEGREAWIPVCSLDFLDGRLDERLEAGYSLDGFPQSAEWVSDASHVRLAEGRLRVKGPEEAQRTQTGFAALHWQEPIGEDMRVAVTFFNEPGKDIRISVSGDTVRGYRFCFDPPAKVTALETVAQGHWEVLQQGQPVRDPDRPSWELVVERSGQWVRAWVDGELAIEYFDPMPLIGPAHRTFGLSSRFVGWSIAGLRAWRRRAPESVSVLEGGRLLLQHKLYREAADFFAEQLATPRGTPLDDEARLLHGLALEGLGKHEEAIASCEQATRSTNRWLAAVACLQMARLHIAAGDTGAGGRAAQRALELHPAAPAADLVGHAIRDGLIKPPAPTPRKQDEEGLRILGRLLGGRFTPTLTRQEVKSIAALKGIPLTNLDIWAMPVTDLGPLRGMPLRFLNCADTGVSDFGPLRGARLERLNCERTPVSSLEPLRGMPLFHLNCNGCRQIADLGPLAGMSLTSLGVVSSQVERVDPLAGMPLTQLDLSLTRVADLSPLRGLALTWLGVRGCPRVTDLSPLAGMPLASLYCEGTGVTDLSPLRGMPLETLSLTPGNISRGIETVRQMRTLKQVGDAYTRLLPAEEFWRRYDAEEFR